MSKISLIGYGSWGKALLKVIAEVESNTSIVLYTRQEKSFVRSSVQEITQNYKKVSITNDLSDVFNGSDISVIATRAQEVSNLVSDVQNLGKKFNSCVITSKGFSVDGNLLSYVVNDIVNDDIAVLSGPNFASEIIAGKLTISTLASVNPEKFKNIFNSPNFKVEICEDIIGVQVCSILKNIFAMGCGIVFGAFQSDNMKAAFMTKAFNELLYIVESFGGKRDTIYTSAGIGDLILTCYSTTSRNHEFGRKFITNTLDNDIGTVEGYASLMLLEKRLDQKMPLCKAIYDLLSKAISKDEFGKIILGI